MVWREMLLLQKSNKNDAGPSIVCKIKFISDHLDDSQIEIIKEISHQRKVLMENIVATKSPLLSKKLGECNAIADKRFYFDQFDDVNLVVRLKSLLDYEESSLFLLLFESSKNGMPDNGVDRMALAIRVMIMHEGLNMHKIEMVNEIIENDESSQMVFNIYIESDDSQENFTCRWANGRGQRFELQFKYSLREIDRVLVKG